MSRIGKNPVSLPQKVTVQITEQQLIVKGPRGELQVPLHSKIKVVEENQTLKVSPKKLEKDAFALWGLTRSLLANAVQGVTEGFSKKLIITGVGYKVAAEGKGLKLALGFSHPVVIEAEPGIEFEVDPKKKIIIVQGNDKQQVGEVAAKIRKLRVPEPYKGKGIALEGEFIRRKAGKTSSKK